MKKVMMIAALAAALVSCQSKGTQNNDAVAMDESVMAVTGNDSSAVAVYEGILPAADGPGIQYVLSWKQLIWMPKAPERTRALLPKERKKLSRKTSTTRRKQPSS